MRKRWLATLHEMARQNERIVFIGSDLSADPALKKFQAELPSRFFMEGVSEAHVVGMAAGIARSGKIVYVNTIASFLSRRCYEQTAIDVALANANVRLIAGGGGLVYGPLGPTHLAIEDVALMRAIPNMTVVVPCDPDEIERVMLASEKHEGPMYIRVAKGGEPVVSKPEHGFELGKAILLREPGEALLIANGVMAHAALVAAGQLERKGIKTGVLNVHTVKPLDTQAIDALVKRCKVVVTAEEHVVNGGLGSAVAEHLAESCRQRPLAFKRMGLPDFFPDEYGSQDSMLAHYGLSPAHLADAVQRLAERHL